MEDVAGHSSSLELCGPQAKLGSVHLAAGRELPAEAACSASMVDLVRLYVSRH